MSKNKPKKLKRKAHYPKPGGIDGVTFIHRSGWYVHPDTKNRQRST